MKKLVISLVRFAARQLLNRYRPEVIAVAGSVGKTSTKRAIAAVLGARFRVRASEKSYNTDLGVPLAILDVTGPGRSFLSMLRAGSAVLGELLTHDPDYPDMLVLEMGADHPGDIGRLVRLAPPKIGVLTAVTPAHMEFFASLDAVALEKATLIAALPEDGTAVVSRDNIRAYEQRGKTRARVITFGMHEEAHVRGSALQLSWEPARVGRAATIRGTTLTVSYQGTSALVELPRAIGMPAVEAALAGAAVGLAKGMSLLEVAEALSRFSPPPSRLTVLPGIKYTTLIDDSYNSSPAALAEALRLFREVAVTGRKIAVLGDMLELGASTRDEHRRAGALAAESGADLLVAVGAAAAMMQVAALEAGLPPERAVHFSAAREAGRFVQDQLAPGDLVLIKGSQGVRLERVVVELMAEPLRAAELVCRNDLEWLSRG